MRVCVACRSKKSREKEATVPTTGRADFAASRELLLTVISDEHTDRRGTRLNT